MKTYIVLLILMCTQAMANNEFMTAKEARKSVQDYKESLLLNAEADLNNRIVERIEKAANDGASSVSVEILKGENQFVYKTTRKLKKLGYTVERKTLYSHDSLVISWEDQ